MHRPPMQSSMSDRGNWSMFSYVDLKALGWTLKAGILQGLEPGEPEQEDGTTSASGGYAITSGSGQTVLASFSGAASYTSGTYSGSDQY
jgi:hypothetical protein